MSWCYRATKYQLPNGEWYYEVREVHRDKSKKIWGWSAKGVRPGGETKQELIRDLEMMLDDVKNTRTFNLEKKRKNYNQGKSNSVSKRSGGSK